TVVVLTYGTPDAEQGALQRTAEDEAARSIARGGYATGLSDELRCIFIGDKGGIVDSRLTRHVPREIVSKQLRLIILVGRNHHACTPAEKGGTDCQLDLVARSIAMSRVTSRNGAFDAGEVGIENVVDHSTDRIGTVHGGSASGDDVD